MSTLELPDDTFAEDIAAARQRLEAGEVASDTVEPASERELAQERTEKMGLWAANLLIDASINPDLFAGYYVREETGTTERKRFLLPPVIEPVVEEVRENDYEGWLLAIEGHGYDFQPSGSRFFEMDRTLYSRGVYLDKEKGIRGFLSTRPEPSGYITLNEFTSIDYDEYREVLGYPTAYLEAEKRYRSPVEAEQAIQASIADLLVDNDVL